MTIELAGVTVRRGGRTILGPLDWTVRAGERWAILGPNGSGKTTLLQVVSLYLWPTSGTVDVLGAESLDKFIDSRNAFVKDILPAFHYGPCPDQMWMRLAKINRSSPGA